MPARSIRSPRAACRSRSARRPRPFPSSWTGARPIGSPSHWGEERDTDDTEGRGGRHQRDAPGRDEDRGPAAALHAAASSRCRRASPPSRSTASGPMISPATARRWSSRPRPVEIDRLDLVDMPGCRPRGIRGRLRQGHLCPGAGPGPRPGAGLPGPCRGPPAHPCRPFGEPRNDFAGRTYRLCAIERPPARLASPTRYGPLRPRWTTSRHWPSTGPMRQGSRGAKP